VKSLGLDSVARVAKWAYTLMDSQPQKRAKGQVINFFALDLERKSRCELMRHSYVWHAYIWNLPRRDFGELYYRARELWPGPAQ